LTSLSVIEQLRSQTDVRERLGKLSDDELEQLLYDWPSWARPNQLAPMVAQNGLPWATWLILAGRGFGKTRVGAEKVREWKRQGFQRVNLIAPTADDLRDVLIEGESGIMAICPPNERPVYRVSKRRLEWPDGSISLLFSAQEPERLRGKQHDKIWADEVAAWRYQQECWDQAMFGLRLGSEPQVIATTTPKPTKLIRELLKDPTTATSRGTTYDNKANLAPTFYTKIITKYEGTRLGRQELNAELLDDNPGALFKRSDIEASRITLAQQPTLVRTVVAIDPAVTSNEDSDETGMITVGMDRRDPPHFYVVEDTSDIYTPDGWAKKAVKVYHEREADRVVGEVNNGGDMIEATLRHQDQNVSYKSVRATKGKEIRAEPVAALYEQHRVHHVGNFAELEDQMVEWNPSTDTDSPDRMDALVWGITELAGGWDEWAGLLRHYQNEGETSSKLQPEAQQPVPKSPGVHPAPPPPPPPTKPAPLKAYERTLAAMTPQRLCSKCKLALKETDSVVSDGFEEWHEQCNRPSWAEQVTPSVAPIDEEHVSEEAKVVAAIMSPPTKPKMDW
jgi:phage terminase large subunit-like protein